MLLHVSLSLSLSLSHLSPSSIFFSPYLSSLSLVAVIVAKSPRTKALEVPSQPRLPPPLRIATGPFTSHSSDSTQTREPDTRPTQVSIPPPWKLLPPFPAHVAEEGVGPRALLEEGVEPRVQGAGSEVISTCSLTRRLAPRLSRSSIWDSRIYEHNLCLSIVHHTFNLL
jgi:hypothetical protein